MTASKINTHDDHSLRDRFEEYLKQRGQSFETITKTKVMVYLQITDIEHGKQIQITEVINDIRTNSDRKNITDKGLLPVAYFSAEIIMGRKCNENVTKHSGLVVIDIDKKDNQEIDLIQLKKDFKRDIYMYACFNSPNGGLKVIIRSNIKSITNHKAYFKSIKQYLLSKYTITKIDQSGCNVARACYLPYDNDIYFNIKASIYRLEQSEIVGDSATSPKYKLSNEPKALLEVEHISYDKHYENILNLLKKRTEIDLYQNIFNELRFKNIDRGIMDTFVPFLELIILKNIYPYRLDWETRLDEFYFKNNPQKQINIMNLGFNDGLEICKIGFQKDYVIKEHYRAKTLGSISMKLIFNNPFCHPDYLIKELQRINNFFCEDPNPSYNPKPSDDEVRNIAMDNYEKFLNGTLDFRGVIKMKPKRNEVSLKYIFKSKEYSPFNRIITHLEAVRIYHEGRNAKNQNSFAQAICVLQDGKKITQKRIAEHMAISTRTVRRYMIKKYDELISRYNKSLKLIKK